MIHAFRLGPLPSPDGSSRHAYVALAEGGEPIIHEATTDHAGLEMLKRGAFGPLTCEPALAEAGRALGLESAPLPEAVLKARAALAFELASGIQHGASKPAAIAAFLRGAAAFWSAHTWEVVAPEERLRVEFLQGHGELDGELSVVGGDGMRLPGVALCDGRGALEELTRLEGDARAEAALRLANLTVDMEREPGWAAEALDEGYGLARIPVAARKRDGVDAPMVTQDLLVAAALLEATAAWTRLDEEGAVGEGTAEIAGMKVAARVRESAKLPVVPEGGLTPVGAEPVPAPASSAQPPPPPPAVAATSAPPVKAPAQAPATTPPAAAQPAGGPAPHREQSAPDGASADLAAKAADAWFVDEPAAAPARAAPAASQDAPRAGLDAPAGADPALDRPSGWLARAWRSIHAAQPGASDEAPAPAAPTPAPAARAAPRATRQPAVARTSTPSATAAPRASTAPTRTAAPTEAADADPFAPFARALKIPIPPEPPSPAATDEATVAELAARVIEAARTAAGELVSFPAVAVEIVERVHDPRADARAVAGFISRDPALAADVVSVANSAAFRGVSEIEGVHEAVARLGLAEVGRVASAVAARKILDPGGKGGARPTTGLFVRAVAVATAAGGAALRQRGARSDHVWLGGLLHDVGRVLVLQLLARLASQPGAHLTPVALGDRIADRVHAEVGEAALRQWGLPAYLLEMCAHHHDATLAPEAVDLHLVRLTSALACLADPAVAARSAREIVQSAAALRMDAAAVRALATDLKAAEERAQALVR